MLLSSAFLKQELPKQDSCDVRNLPGELRQKGELKMKHFMVCLCLLFCVRHVFAQETIEKEFKTAPGGQ